MSSSNKKLSPQVQQRIKDLLEEGKSKRRIAKILGVSDRTVRKYTDGFMREQSPADEDTTRNQFFELRERYRKAIGWDGKLKPAKPVARSAETRITAIGDVHTPFQDEESLTTIVRATKKDTDILVDCGDSNDNFNFSRYEKFRRPYSPIEELQKVQAYYLMLAENYSDVRLMWGNHDARFIKWLVRLGVSPDVLEYLEFCAPGITINPAARILDGIPNVKVVEPIKIDEAEFAFIYQINDTVFSHAEKFSTIPNKAVLDVTQWLMSFAIPAGVVKPFKVVVQAHTHQAGVTYGSFGVLCIENGCVTKMPDYAGDPKRLTVRKPVIGYSRIYQVNGVTDIARTNFIPVKW